MFYATLTVTLPGYLTLDQRDELIEKIRETAYPERKGRILTITWEAENEWDLRGAAESTLEEVTSNFEFRDLSNILDTSNVKRYQKE